MMNPGRSNSPIIMLKIRDGVDQTRRTFTDFDRAVRCAEAYAEVGFSVDMVSATGQFLMGFGPRRHEVAV